MYLLVYLPRIQVGDRDRPVLGHTHQVPSLLLIRLSRTPVGHEQLSDWGGVVRVDQDDRGDAVLVEFVIVAARVRVFKHREHEDTPVGGTHKVAGVLG